MYKGCGVNQCPREHLTHLNDQHRDFWTEFVKSKEAVVLALWQKQTDKQQKSKHLKNLFKSSV